jgi:hypothetical protein
VLDKNARSTAIAKGSSRSEQLSWEKMASETVKAENRSVLTACGLRNALYAR